MSPVEFKNWLEKRTKDFAVATFSLLDALPKKVSTRVIAFQLGKSASSVGANYREANRAESRDDFVHKISIALKEASESAYCDIKKRKRLRRTRISRKAICLRPPEYRRRQNLLFARLRIQSGGTSTDSSCAVPRIRGMRRHAESVETSRVAKRPAFKFVPDIAT